MEANNNTQTPEEIPSLIDTETPSTSNHKLKYIIIGALILMLGLAGGIYFSRNFLQSPNTESVQNTPAASQTISPSPESDEMEGWKTYTNEELAFGFKHPSDWFYNVDSYKRINFFKANTTPLLTEGGHQGNELLVIYQVESALSWDEYREDLAKRLNITEDFFPQQIGDQSAFRFHDENFGNNSYIVKSKTGFLHLSFGKADYNTIDQILSTFEFMDIEKNTTAIPTPTSNPQITQSTQTITYTPISGWETYSSISNELTFQHPPAFKLVSEGIENSACLFAFSNDTGGIIQGNIAPYDGGSRRVHYGKYFEMGAGYTYTFEDVYIHGVKALIVETGPIGDSGTGTAAIIPKGKYALILHISNRGKDDETFLNILKSISNINFSGACA